MSNETCPHCGAERSEYGYKRYYSCWTQINAPSIRDVDCYKRQLAAKDAEIERLKQAVLDERKRLMQLFTDPENQPTQYGTVTLEYMEREIAKEREACAKVCEGHVCTSDCSAYGLGSNCEFVISAEIRARGVK